MPIVDTTRVDGYSVGSGSSDTRISMMVNPTVEQITRAIEEKRTELAEFLDMLHAHGQTVSITLNSELGTWTCSFRGHPKAEVAR